VELGQGQLGRWIARQDGDGAECASRRMCIRDSGSYASGCLFLSSCGNAENVPVERGRRPLRCDDLQAVVRSQRGRRPEWQSRAKDGARWVGRRCLDGRVYRKISGETEPEKGPYQRTTA
jgi:hypothetical protein